MKEELKYNFLNIISLHYFKFYNCFILCCIQGCHFFVIPSDQTRAPESSFVRGGQNLKKVPLFKKKFSRVAIL